MPNKFQFFEYVIVKSDKPELAAINGREAPIVGMGEYEDDVWRYVLYFDDLEGAGGSVAEGDLVSTGRIGKRSDVYPGDSIRVRPDGTLISDD